MITSTHNTRIKEARKLMQRKERYATQRLLLEGLRLVKDGWRAGAKLNEVFYAADARQTHPALDELLVAFERQQIDCQACTTQVFSSLTETVTSQGIIAVAAMPQWEVPSRPSLVLLLDQVRDPGNAGTLLRSANAAGVDWVIVAPDTVDPYNDKVLRAGMGVHFRLPLRVCEDWQQVQNLLPKEIPIYLADAQATLPYEQCDWRQPAVLAIGGEANGASNFLRNIATSITIPMQGATESLNAAMAGTVILFEAARQRRQQNHEGMTR
jgi:RNA methyltransferase, TrmH family